MPKHMENTTTKTETKQIEQVEVTVTREDLEKAWIREACRHANLYVGTDDINPVFEEKYYRLSPRGMGRKNAYAYVEAGSDGKKGAQVFICVPEDGGKAYYAYALFNYRKGVEVNELVERQTLFTAFKLFQPLMVWLAK